MSGADIAPPLRHVVIRGASLTAAGQLSTQALTFAAYLVLARLAAPATFGAFAAASILVNLGTLLVESGMSAAIVQRRDRIEEATATAFVSTALGGLVLSALTAAASPLVGHYFHSARIGHLALAVSGTHFVTSLGIVPNALLQRELAFRKRIVVDPISVVVLGATGIIGLGLGAGPWALLAASYASVSARVVTLWVLAAWAPDLRLTSLSMWRELTSFARHILAGEILRESNRITITALIGRFIGTAGLGQYNFGSRFATQANTLVINSSSYVLFPTFSRLADEPARVRSGFLRALRVIVVTTVPASLILLPLGRSVPTLLLGARWRPAGDVLMALCGLVAGSAIASTCAEALKGQGKSAATFRMQVVATTSSIALVVGLYHFGAAGVAAAVSVSAVLSAAYGLAKVSDSLQLSRHDVLGVILRPLVAGAAMALTLLVIVERFPPQDQSSELLGLALLAGEAVLGVVLYGAVLGVLFPREARGILATWFRAERNSS